MPPAPGARGPKRGDRRELGFPCSPPAQIRAAYRLPALPAGNAKPNAVQAANLGSGQTIYLVDANSSPNMAADLATFNSTFGLPGCTVKPILASTRLPLAAPAAGSGCTFSIAYVDANGAVTSTAPAYDAGWAVEIGMDVEWAHATAPMARIVLLEAQGVGLSQLSAAVQLANAMGRGIVSMSFGAGEGPYMASVQSIFASTGKMGYVSSTGDSGSGVAWPLASPSVLAVGGTTLSYTGSGGRNETTWSRTGGGISAYEVEPAYQATVSAPGEPAAMAGSKVQPMRSVDDVSFNADPNSGQYLVVTPAGAKSPNWYRGGGTSIGSPQWAGLLAVANAQRAASGKVPLGQLQTALYKNIGAVEGLYAGAFLDVTTGRDGSCAACAAVVGYDAAHGTGHSQRDGPAGIARGRLRGSEQREQGKPALLGRGRIGAWMTIIQQAAGAHARTRQRPETTHARAVSSFPTAHSRPNERRLIGNKSTHRAFP